MYSKYGDLGSALRVFSLIPMRNEVSRTATITGCVLCVETIACHWTYSEGWHEFDSEPRVVAALMVMYCRFEQAFQLALFVFEQEEFKDIVIWSSMMVNSSRNGYYFRTMELFDQKDEERWYQTNFCDYCQGLALLRRPVTLCWQCLQPVLVCCQRITGKEYTATF
ncbi:hypothetical protein J5N97_016248 [Dioscorea zingiberensis]|uniref:Uncharacterized protein n=1 Tax=Dioscorea zingiberensis TaxID=325984 RepID=A0A9D5HFG1_9LILI|nr:hypothetical protein J5N97_016248 [Dioscorea zingiberensis]